MIRKACNLISNACDFLIVFLKNNWIILTILLIGAFFRLYNISNYLTFLGDEGRDAIIVRNLIINFDPILIGPGTSVGGMYLGPLYYYFMAPFLYLANYSPTGPAVGVALLGIATIYLVYIVGKDWFSKNAGLIAASLFAISPTVIVYSHSSWNPNIMPFFALLSIYSIWLVYSKRVYKWLYVTAISFAFVLQSHYLGVLIAPVLIIYWYFSKVSWKFTFLSILIFGFLMSPLVLFDLRHGWINLNALTNFLTVKQGISSFNPFGAVTKIYPIFEQVTSSMITAKIRFLSNIITAILTIMMMSFLFFKNKIRINNSAIAILISWLCFGLIGLGVYNQSIHDHYFGFLFPVPFLIVGLIVSKIMEGRYKLLGIIVLLFLFFINLNNNPFWKNPNYQMRRAYNVSTKVIEIVGNDPFNIAVLSDWNYEAGYQYFLEKENIMPIKIDSQLPETVTKQLIIICENLRDKCDPTHSPKAEVANFGWSKIESEYLVDGVIIYKLVHSYPENK